MVYEIILIGAISLIVLFVLGVFAYTMYRKQEIYAETEHYKYLNQKRKLRIDSKVKQSKFEDSDDDDAQEFIDSLPPWLSSIAEGANINMEAVYEGDPAELKKVKDIIEKNLPGTSNQSSGELIG